MRIQRLLSIITITIFLTGSINASVIFPDNWDGIGDNPDPLECDEYYPENSDGNPHPDLTGYPTRTT